MCLSTKKINFINFLCMFIILVLQLKKMASENQPVYSLVAETN